MRLSTRIHSDLLPWCSKWTTASRATQWLHGWLSTGFRSDSWTGENSISISFRGNRVMSEFN